MSCLALTPVLTIALAGVSGWSIRRAIDTHDPMLLPGFDPAASGFDAAMYGQRRCTGNGDVRATAMYGQLGLVVFGVLAVTSDQADGMLRICLTAIPRRGRCHAGKLLVLPGAVLVVALSLTLLCLLSATVATVLRSPVAALSLLLPTFSMGPYLLTRIPLAHPVAQFLPDQAGARAMAVGAPATEGLSPAAGLAVLLIWTAAGVAAGYLALRLRDV